MKRDRKSTEIDIRGSELETVQAEVDGEYESGEWMRSSWGGVGGSRITRSENRPLQNFETVEVRCRAKSFVACKNPWECPRFSYFLGSTNYR